MSVRSRRIGRALSNEIAAIGALTEVGGFSLAGVRVYVADTAELARDVWDALPETVGIAILSPLAAEALGPERTEQSECLTIVMPG